MDPLLQHYIPYAHTFCVYPSLYFNIDSVTDTFYFLSFFFYVRGVMCGKTNLSEPAGNNGGIQ